MSVVVNFELISRTITTSDKPNKAVVAIHGWTGDEYVFEPIAKMINLNHTKWYFPRAPYEADSGKGYSWFHGSDNKGWEFQKTISGMNNLIKRINSDGFIAKDIYFLGFSQGATLALEFALRLPYAIGGIIPIAGFIKFKDKINSEGTKESKKTPILILHGNQDKIIPVSASITTHSILKKRKNPVLLKTYDAGHKIPTTIVPDIKEFILDTKKVVKVSH